MPIKMEVLLSKNHSCGLDCQRQNAASSHGNCRGTQTDERFRSLSVPEHSTKGKM